MSAGLDATLDDCLWPLDRRDELTAALASAAGIAPLGPADRFELSYADVAPTLTARARAEAPAVLRVGSGAGTLLGIVGYAGADVRLLAPGGTVVTRAVAALSTLLRAPVEASSPTGVEAAVAQAGFAGTRGESVRAALLAAALGGERVAEGARLRPAQRSIGTALRAAGVGRRLGAALLGYVGQLALLVALWGTIGTRAVAASSLGGGGWGWIALIALLAAVRLASSRAAGRLAIDAGAVLRDRILHGLLRLDTEPLRAAGIGRLMGRVADVEAVESLALGGGLTAAVGIFELVTGLCVLAVGVAPVGELAFAELGFAAAWGLLAVALAVRVQRSLRAWSTERLALTHDLVERMVGQRTLVAQQPSELWHRDEDRALALYSSRGRALDGAVAALTVVVPRGFLIGALLILAPRFGEAALRPGAFAASLGGLLFVTSALRKLAQAFPALGAAAIAWRNIGDLLAGDETLAAPAGATSSSASSVAAQSASSPTAQASPAAARGALIEARAVGFRYPGRLEPVLDDCALEHPARRSGAARRPLGRRQVDARGAARRAARARLGPAAARRARPEQRSARERWRRACRRGAAVPREPRLHRARSSSTCCSAAPGRPAARTSSKPRRSAASSTSARSWTGCRPASSRWSARPAGSSRTASGAGSTSRVRSLQRADARHPRRELRRPRPGDARACARLRAQPRGDPGRHRAPVVPNWTRLALKCLSLSLADEV